MSVDDLAQRYRQAHDPVERTHWQIIWLHAQGHPVQTIAQMTSYSTIWIYDILHRYDEHGPDGVGDRRHQNPGQPPWVPPEVREKLAPALDGPAPDGGLWTSKKVAAWVAQRLGRDHVHTGRDWELLRQLGYRPYAPRPRHQKADPAEQDAWKKNRRCNSRVPKHVLSCVYERFSWFAADQETGCAHPKRITRS